MINEYTISVNKRFISNKSKFKVVCFIFEDNKRNQIDRFEIEDLKDTHTFKIDSEIEPTWCVVWPIDKQNNWLNNEEINLTLNNSKIKTKWPYAKGHNLSEIELGGYGQKFIEFNPMHNTVPETALIDQNNSFKEINFNYNNKNYFFNSAIFEFLGNTYFCVRHEFVQNASLRFNTFKIFNSETLKEIPLNITDEIKDEQYEDPRVFVHDNKLYISCSTYEHGKSNLIHVKILVFDEDFNHIDNIHINYGKNGSDIKTCSGQEKNWCFFVKDNFLYCIYDIDPFVILKCDFKGNIINEYVLNRNLSRYWPFGKLRGGTNPILINGSYHLFFHSSLPYNNKLQRRYFAGYLNFDFNEPFEPKLISNSPLFWGNEMDIRNGLNPPVVFPSGALYKDNNIVVSFGINDERTGIITYEI